MDLSEVPIIVAVVVCFIVGYLLVNIVNILFKALGWGAATEARQGRTPEPGREGYRFYGTDGEVERDERHYRTVIGVSQTAGEEEIVAAYRAKLGTYHPDRVTHLGGEFCDLASRRTRDIIEAYEYLRRKYKFR